MKSNPKENKQNEMGRKSFAGSKKTEMGESEVPELLKTSARSNEPGFGNEAQRAFNPAGGGMKIQPKLEIGEVNDPAEKEADRAADAVVNGGSVKTPVGGAGDAGGIGNNGGAGNNGNNGKGNGNGKPIVQMKGESGAKGGMTAPAAVESKISAKKGGGQGLAGQTKSKMESGFGTDFSDVRIHADSESAQMNSSIGAKAFTQGKDIFFAKGQFNPGTQEGDRLLAHELAHTVQGGSVVRREVEGEIDPVVITAQAGSDSLPEKIRKKLARNLEYRFKGYPARVTEQITQFEANMNFPSDPPPKSFQSQLLAGFLVPLIDGTQSLVSGLMGPVGTAFDILYNTVKNVIDNYESPSGSTSYTTFKAFYNQMKDDCDAIIEAYDNSMDERAIALDELEAISSKKEKREQQDFLISLYELHDEFVGNNPTSDEEIELFLLNSYLNSAADATYADDSFAGRKGYRGQPIAKLSFFHHMPRKLRTLKVGVDSDNSSRDDFFRFFGSDFQAKKAGYNVVPLDQLPIVFSKLTEANKEYLCNQIREIAPQSLAVGSITTSLNEGVYSDIYEGKGGSFDYDQLQIPKLVSLESNPKKLIGHVEQSFNSDSQKIGRRNVWESVNYPASLSRLIFDILIWKENVPTVFRRGMR